ncbi:AMP-binding protein [Mycobacterium sp. CVI_P3]|uniref:AMP-binding protein n=1 Tax=Mycobacterium pinniadriaticum TaxID=2994102 RepID=A0ABT3SAR6_9MYCO|nr:AMP-binding protein [Mycobacterium pinniadriaticum]MCX2929874.1 AMP-binding protein [Mycobacterium pinniadriaticum]MCX2936477.1 AMP-binding protein [Mycobacterium pinniadriaticum]
MHITDHLAFAARSWPDRYAFGGDGGDITFAAAQSRVNGLARALRADGFDSGTPFAVVSPNDSRALVALLGAMRAGGAWCNVTLAAPTEVTAGVLRRGGCRLLLFHSSIADRLPVLLSGIPSLTTVLCIDSEATDYPSVAAWTQGHSDAELDLAIPSDALGCQGVTGGTTGEPKITQAANTFILKSATSWATCWHFDKPPVNLAVAPITHAGGMIALAQLQFGGTTVCMATPDVGRVIEAVERHRVTTVFLPPTLIYRLLAHPELARRDLSCLRYVISAAAPIAPDRIAEAVDALGPVVAQAYGQTEAGFPLTWMSPDDIAAAIRSSDTARLASCGRPTSLCTRMEAMDAAGAVLPAGQTGEIVLQGPATMLRYLDDPEATADIRRYGWHHTGDIGRRNPDGFVYITDRLRDLIISGGFNVFPFEVEQAILMRPEVADCAVIGIPSEQWGESVHACVELRPGAALGPDALIEHCKRTVGSIKAPKSVEYLTDLPRSPVGKVLKRALRENYWADHAGSII